MRDFLLIFFPHAHFALQNVNKDSLIFSYFHKFVAYSDQKPKSKNWMNKTLVSTNTVSTNTIYFSLQFHEYPWPITTSVPVMNTMIVLIIRTVSTLRGHTLALARMDIMTYLDLIPCQAEFVQVI